MNYLKITIYLLLLSVASPAMIVNDRNWIGKAHVAAYELNKYIATHDKAPNCAEDTNERICSLIESEKENPVFLESLGKAGREYVFHQKAKPYSFLE